MAHTRLRVVQHNVLTWNNRKHELSNTYRTLDPDIILIQSHGITNNETFKIHGYKTITSNYLNRHVDGTAIAIKQNIQHNIIGNFLTNTLAIKIQTQTGPIIIATDYIPPSRLFIPIPDYNTLFRRQEPVYFFADLNAHHPTFGYRDTNTTGRQLHQLMLNRTIQHLGPHFTTFHTHNSATSPDIVLSNLNTYHNIHITQGPITTSDHNIIIADINTNPIQIPIPARPNFTQANWENFKTHIDQHTTPTDLTHATIEEIDNEIDTWYNNITQAINTHIPKTTNRPLTGTTPSHTTQLIIQQYNALTQHAQNNGWTLQHYRHYKQLQRTLQHNMQQEQNTNWANTLTQLANSHPDPETFWRKVKSLTNDPTQHTHYILHNNTKIYNTHQQERIHRNIWREVFNEEEEESDLDEENSERVREFLQTNIQRTYPNHQADPTKFNNENPLTSRINVNEIKGIIKAMKKSCPGESGINKTILKNLPESSLVKLKDIFDSTISAGYFPDKFKSSIIRLIPKHGKSPLIATNYRPISLLEVPGKILERLINTRLRHHLETNNLHNPLQFGFRQCRGTTHALAITTEYIALSKADGGQCHIVLRDITKAFDKVWHRGLKYKLLNLGLPTITEKLLCDFLDGREARIRLDSYLGPTFQTTCGVPQGSVLSPTLFIIYTRDTPQSLRGLNISYADDITQVINYEGKSKHLMNARTREEVERVNRYERAWKIKTNVNKFSIIPISSFRNEDLIIDDDAQNFKTSGKILGLKISNTSYISHVSERKGKAIYALSRLFRLRKLPSRIKLHLVKTLVLPVLDYPPIPTHALSKTQTLILQRVQNKALRFATDTRYPYNHTTEELHNTHKIKPLNIRIHNKAQKIWNTIQRLYPTLHENFTQKIEQTQKFHRNYPSSIIATQQEIQNRYTQ